MLKLGTAIAVFLITCYQWTISPLKRLFFGPGCGCRFYPTCSHYGREAFKKHGFFTGFTLTFIRILKCHPFHPGGVDAVPDSFSFKTLFNKNLAKKNNYG